MDFRPIERAPDAFQQPVSAEQIVAMCRRAFDLEPLAAVELGHGQYNNTYRVDLDTRGPVVLRVAPEPARQSRIERELMRNEVASVPFLAPIAELMPRLLAVDFSHELIGRDYLFQGLLPGVPAPKGFSVYPRSTWPDLYRQLGTIARSIHAVRGESFGPVAGPAFATWGEAVLAYFDDLVLDLDDARLPVTDVRDVAGRAAGYVAILDQIAEPRLLHGDLWTVNLMLTPEASVPTICGVLDCDRTSWGDPAADWTIRMAGLRPGTERDAFWETYGPLETSREARIRARIYRGMHAGAVRLERHRHGRPGEDIDAELADVLAGL